MSEDEPTTITANNPPTENNANSIADTTATYAKDMTAISNQHLPSDISDTLKAPILPNVNPDAISHEQAHAGISVHIPGSLKMCQEDVILFYWGKNLSSTTIHHRVGSNSVVRVLCISYNFLPFVQYGLVDLYYEVYREERLIGTSPALKVNVSYSAPVTPRQRQRKRSVSRRYPGK